eukprot:TRINITY_DN10958_c0_g1_i1.p1 TRINITY_DN10958_c0_g1~~TRINITY_DN10958_c0_g1_i1.p1  ORF type:complete len:632 (-),score=214.10 TRINITY_DN10958_c0_g1_i1:8-1903(-)
MRSQDSGRVIQLKFVFPEHFPVAAWSTRLDKSWNVKAVIQRIAGEAGVEGLLEGNEGIWVRQENIFLDEDRTLFEYPQLIEYDCLYVKKYGPHYRVGVLGIPRSGKTTLIRRFALNDFKMKYSASLECTYRSTMKVNANGSGSDSLCSVEIWDSGSDQQSAMRNCSIINMDAFILAFQVTDLSSLLSIKDIYKTITNIQEFSTRKNLIFHLVGTKSEEKLWDISEKKVEELAKELNCGYTFVSAKTGDKVGLPFNEILDQLMRFKPTRSLWKEKKVEDKSVIEKSVVTGLCGKCKSELEAEVAAENMKNYEKYKMMRKKENNPDGLKRPALEVSLNVFKEEEDEDNPFGEPEKKVLPKEVPKTPKQNTAKESATREVAKTPKEIPKQSNTKEVQKTPKENSRKPEKTVITKTEEKPKPAEKKPTKKKVSSESTSSQESQQSTESESEEVKPRKSTTSKGKDVKLNIPKKKLEASESDSTSEESDRRPAKGSSTYRAKEEEKKPSRSGARTERGEREKEREPAKKSTKEDTKGGRKSSKQEEVKSPKSKSEKQPSKTEVKTSSQSKKKGSEVKSTASPRGKQDEKPKKKEETTKDKPKATPRKDESEKNVKSSDKSKSSKKIESKGTPKNKH